MSTRHDAPDDAPAGGPDRPTPAPRRRRPSVSRRRFLSSAAAASAAVAAPTLLPRGIRGQEAPSERVIVGHVGVGGRGGSLLGQTSGNPGATVAGVCDVDAKRLAVARQRAGSDSVAVTDFRRVLDIPGLDAVVVATPDHWHANVTILACRAGKDVYVEKPLCYTIREGRAMVGEARKHGRMVQVGIHHRSAPYMREIARIVRSGCIGRVDTVRCWMWENPVAKRTPPVPPPPDLDWDRWLGPAPVAPYHPGRAHFHFRWCEPYAGGYMTDWGAHMFNVVTYAMDADLSGPTEVAATGTFAAENLYDFPTAMEATWKFDRPAFTLTWTQPATGGDVLPGQKYGMTFCGERGQLRTGFGDGLHKFYRDGREEPLPAAKRDVEIPESPGHMQNWLDSVRSRKLPIADVEIGHRTTTLCQLGNIALFSRQRILWDPEKDTFRGRTVDSPWYDRRPRPKYAI